MIILALIVGFFAAVAAFFLHRIINQHIARHHPHTLCHLFEQVAAEVAQLLVVGHCLGHHHRLRWICGC